MTTGKRPKLLRPAAAGAGSAEGVNGLRLRQARDSTARKRFLEWGVPRTKAAQGVGRVSDRVTRRATGHAPAAWRLRRAQHAPWPPVAAPRVPLPQALLPLGASMRSRPLLGRSQGRGYRPLDQAASRTPPRRARMAAGTSRAAETRGSGISAMVRSSP